MRVSYTRSSEKRSFPARRLLVAVTGVAVSVSVAWKLEKTFPPSPVNVTGNFSSHPKADPRTIRLKRFLVKLHCPIANLSEDFVNAADDNHLDWRLLPSIAVVESGGGKAYIKEKNNIFGWGGGELSFPTLRSGLNEVAYKLGRSPLYRHHSSLGKLHLYNPDENYAQQVLSVMRRISPVMNIRSAEGEAVQTAANEFVYEDVAAR